MVWTDESWVKPCYQDFINFGLSIYDQEMSEIELYNYIKEYAEYKGYNQVFPVDKTGALAKLAAHGVHFEQNRGNNE